MHVRDQIALLCFVRNKQLAQIFLLLIRALSQLPQILRGIT
jgi:hypothetical protein